MLARKLHGFTGALYAREVTKKYIWQRNDWHNSDDQTKRVERDQFCSEYFKMMVAPFSNEYDIADLKSAADQSWLYLFKHFPKLEAISAKSCLRSDHPSTTSTHAYLQQCDKTIVDRLHFAEDVTYSLAWTSMAILLASPSSVRELDICVTSDFTVPGDFYGLVKDRQRFHRLTNISCDEGEGIWRSLTKLSLSFPGVEGRYGYPDEVHGSPWPSSIRFWKERISSLSALRHLQLKYTPKYHGLGILGSDTIQKVLCKTKDACALDYFFFTLELENVQVLEICDFLFHESTIDALLSLSTPKLQKLVLNDIKISPHDATHDGTCDVPRSGARYPGYRRGASWLRLCEGLDDMSMGMTITRVNRPICVTGDGDWTNVDEKYVEQIRELESVFLDCDTLEGRKFYRWGYVQCSEWM